MGCHNSHCSAAAVCIEFLDRSSVALRGHIRHIILQETRPGVVNPESHASGLVPCE